MKLWKRLLAIPIAASLVMGLPPAPTLAEDTTHSHPICGAAHADIGDHTGDNCKDATWTAWDGTSEITYDANNTAYVYLASNATRNNRLIVKTGYTLYLCLNGRELKSSVTSSDDYQGMSQVINVDNGAKFILCDCKDSGTITHSPGAKGKGVRVGTERNPAATFSMYGGTISGNHADAQCWGSGGAGVEIHNGTFKMYGGTISDNYEENTVSNYGGGGVCAHSSGTFTMYGGTINNNHSETDAGGVTVVGDTMNIYGGTIRDNTAKNYGGGIWTNSNEFKISGNSVIENNTAGVDGGGLCYYASYSYNMTISDSARISGNTATGNGGGICFESKGTLTMNGGSITGNTTTGNGGGVYFKGGAFSISGNLDISGNKKSGADNNVYLPTNKYITIAGALTGSNPIGVTTETTPDASNYVHIASGSKNYAAPEQFQYENDITPVSAIIRKNGNTADLVVCNHSWHSTWSSDSSSHWHDCSICKGKRDVSAHTYNQQVQTKAYEKSSATCLSGTTYYMSCVCGAKGADTFEIGDKDPDNHSGILNNDWKSNDTNHWKEYSCCRAHAEEAAHSGGTATCQNKAVCSTCNKPYGDLGSHVPASTWSKDASGHWHACQTPNCNENLAFAAHTPGPAATEDAPQLCTVCSYELAPALEHTHVWGAWISNGDGTHTRTCAKDSSHTETNACSGGTATCQNKAVCSTCNKPYGDLRVTPDTDTEDQSALNGSQVSKLKLPILLATGKGGNRKITISWRSYEDADGYDCYWSYCDGKRSYKKLATVKAAKDRVTSRRLDNNRRYKYFVVAYKLIDGKKVYIAKSYSLHVALKDAKATNAKKVTVNQTNVRLKAGDTFVIRSRTRLENTNKKELLHVAAYRYYTSDQSVASVSKTGKIKALKSGTCVIYVVANNGVYGTIKVIVN